jgi:hypothetical protein
MATRPQFAPPIRAGINSVPCVLGGAIGVSDAPDLILDQSMWAERRRECSERLRR